LGRETQEFRVDELGPVARFFPGEKDGRERQIEIEKEEEVFCMRRYACPGRLSERIKSGEVSRFIKSPGELQDIEKAFGL
jgi:hypothetical protein